MVEDPERGETLEARPGVVREAVGREVFGLMFYRPKKSGLAPGAAR